jgi:phage shock protein A
MRGIASLLTTGSWAVENAADQARTTDRLLERIPEAANHDAERTLTVVNDALTSFELLKQKLQSAVAEVAKWQGNVETAVAKYSFCAEGDPLKAKYENLAKSAIAERKKAEALRDQLQTAVSEAGPQAEEALKAAEQAGFRRETAKSQTEVLRVKDATAQAAANLAKAAQGSGNSEASALLAEAEEKVAKHIAEARANKMVADALPKSAEQVDADLSDLSRQDDINAEFTKLTSPANTG